jgi:hypothetical protein
MFLSFIGIVKVTYVQIMMFLENVFMYVLHSYTGFPVFLTTEKKVKSYTETFIDSTRRCRDWQIYEILVQNTEENRPLWRSRHKY